MSNLSQNLAFIIVLAISLLSIFSLIRWSHAKYRHLYVNDVQDFSKHYYRYLLYFWGVGIFIPSSEIILEVFKIREQSELYYNLLAGGVCLGIGYTSKYSKTLQENLHRLFVGFFVVFNILTLYRTSYNPMDLLTLAEFTIFLMISYHVFYKVKHFYLYFIAIFCLLLSYRLLNFISTDAFIIYFNSTLIAFTINYVIRFIDLSIKENLFFAYNIVNNGNLLVIGIDTDGFVVFVSENIKDILGYYKEEWIGKNWYNEMINIVDTEDSKELKHGISLQRIALKNKSYKLIEWRDEPTYNNLSIKIGRDITESEQAKIELKRTKEILEQTNRVGRVGGWEFDLITQKGYSSEITKEIFEVSQTDYFDFQTAINYFEEGEHRNKIMNAVENCIKYGTDYDFEVLIITAKGNKRWIRAKGTAEFVDNQCKRIYGTAQDIDEQVKAKVALIQSEEKFRFISENTSDVIAVFNYQKLAYVSPSHEKLFGHSTEEISQMTIENIFDLVHIDDRDRVKKTIIYSMESQISSCNYVYRFLHKNGTYVWREDSVDIVYDLAGRPSKMIVLARDVSERKAIEQANQLRQEKILLQNNILIRISTTSFDEYGSWAKNLQNITEAAVEGMDVNTMSVWEYQDDVIECSDFYDREKHTHSSGERLNANSFPSYFEGLRNGLAIVANDALTNEYTYEFAEVYLKPLDIKSMLDIPIRVDGELVGLVCWEQTHEQKVWSEDDIAFARSISDIILLGMEADKRRKAEIELKRAKDLLEQTNRVARVGGWEYNLIKKQIYYSDIFKEIFEESKDNEPDFYSAIKYFDDGEDREKVFQTFENCLKQGMSYDYEIQIITAKGNKRWIRAKGSAEFANGLCKRIYGTVQDIDERVKLYELIKEKEYQYRTLISNISSVAFRCLNNSERTMLFISDAIERLTGYSASDFINNVKRSYASVIHPDDKEYVNTAFEDNITKGEEYTIEYRLIDINNNIVWVNEKGKGYVENVEQPLFLDGVITDITERKNAEETLFENQRVLVYKSKILAAIAKITEKLLVSNNIEQTLQESFTLIGEAIEVDRVYYFENDITTNRINHKVEWVRESITPQINNPITKNLTFEDIHFYLDSLLQNKSFQSTISELNDEKIKERWRKQEISSVLLLPIFIKNTFYGFIGFDDCFSEQQWSTDKLNILQSLATNIANAIERINNETIIKESENIFRQINETIEDVFLLFDCVAKRYLYVSPSCKKVLDAEPAFFYEGHSYVQKFIFEEDQHINDIIGEQLLRNGSSEVEYKIKTSSGQIKWIHQKSFAIHNEKGEMVRISGICSDITEKKLTQNEVKQLSLVAERITNGVLIADSTGRVLWANQAFLDMMEIPLEKLLNNRPRDLFNPGNNMFAEKMSVMNGYNFSLEIEVKTFKKNKKWIQINNTSIKNEAGETEQQIEVVIDITERKKAEEKQKESERKLNIILNSLDQLVWAISVDDYRLLFAGKSFKSIYGKSIRYWKKNFNIWKESIHPEDKKIGEKIEQDILTYGAAYGIYRIIDTDGNLKWLENSAKIVNDENNEPLMIMGITTDISDKKAAEKALIKAHEEADIANKSKAELELRALQMQMNPHFVFNALNSIQSYVMNHDTLTANNYLSKFAHLIRLFLDSSRSKFISIGEEVRLLTLYIELEKLRFDEKFDFEILFEGNVNKYFEIPTMILQPFIENAINHGLRYKKEKGLLSVKFYLEENYVICKIEDNGVGRKNVGEIQSKSSKGYQSQGLKITAERLHTYNKINDASIIFSITDKITNPTNPDDEVGTVIEIKFPEN